MKYTCWATLMHLAKEGRRHKDLEVRSAILDDMVALIDEMNEDKDALTDWLISQAREGR